MKRKTFLAAALMTAPQSLRSCPRGAPPRLGAAQRRGLR